MALLNQNITSALQNAQPENYDLLPPGTYSLQAEKAELIDTKDGFGQYIKVQFNVLGPEYAGRKVFCNFNIRNRSAEAERIGVSQLKAFILAGGVQEPLVDTDQLLGAMVSGKSPSRNPKTHSTKTKTASAASNPSARRRQLRQRRQAEPAASAPHSDAQPHQLPVRQPSPFPAVQAAAGLNRGRRHDGPA